MPIPTTIDRTGCPGTRHGDYNAYQTYGCRCPDAGDAYYRYQKAGRLGTRVPLRIPAIGTRRRVQALMAIGYTRAEIAAAAGRDERAIGHLWHQHWVYRTTADAIRRIYDTWSMTPGNSDKTCQYARRRSYAPPLAWDDDTIDDPKARPKLGSAVSIAYDHAKVERALDRVLTYEQLTPAERAEAVRRLNAAGLNDQQIADALQHESDAIERRRQRMGLPVRAGTPYTTPRSS